MFVNLKNWIAYISLECMIELARANMQIFTNRLS